MAIQLFTRS